MNEIIEQSRRGFLAALATTGIGVAATTSLVHADDGDPAGTGGGAGTTKRIESGPAFRTEAFPPPTAGTSYQFTVGAEFIPNSLTAGPAPLYSKGFGELQTSAGGIFYFPLSELPKGAVITEVTGAIIKSGAATDTTLWIYRFSSGNIESLDSKSSGAFAPSAVEQNLTLTVAATPQWVIDNSLTQTHWLVATLSAGGRLNSVRVGYIDPTPPFHPIAPKRVYDSRFIAPLGPLVTNDSRVVSVANGYPNGSGTIDVPDVVPVGAKAVAYNITVVNTLGTGFMSVNPGGATVAGGSSINWFGPAQILANGLVVTLDAGRQIKVFCGGGGSADFLIDVLGYYL